MMKNIEKLVELVDEVAEKYGLSFTTALDVVKTAAGGADGVPELLEDECSCDCDKCDDSDDCHYNDEEDEELYYGKVGSDGRLHIPMSVLDSIYEITGEKDEFTAIRYPSHRGYPGSIVLLPGDHRDEYTDADAVLLHPNAKNGAIQVYVKNSFKPGAEVDIFVDTATGNTDIEAADEYTWK